MQSGNSLLGLRFIFVTLAAGLVFVTLAAGCGRWADRAVCGDGPCSFTTEEWSRIQSLANITGKPPRPDPSNKYLPIVDWRTRAVAADAYRDLDGTLVDGPWLDVPEVRLGWRLYHEPALSGSVSDIDVLKRPALTTRPNVCGQVNVSCSTCHDPRRQGSDLTSSPRHVSIGAGWYDVNAQQTLNAAYYPILYWNGRTDTLWAQAAQVIESAVSMNGHRMKTFWVVINHHWDDYAQIFGDTAPLALELASRLKPPAASAPTAAYMKQYKEELSPSEQEIVTRVHVNVAKAIAAYEWLLSSDNSPFDQYVRNQGRSGLSPAAERGLKVFIGRGSCIDCHNTPLFSDGKFHNIGIPQVGPHVPSVSQCVGPPCDCQDAGIAGASCWPAGARAGQQKLASQEFHRGGTNNAYDDHAASQGAAAGESMDAGTTDRVLALQVGAWRTPSLRDVAMTAPYMHDGLFATLADVVWHYDQGGGESEVGKIESVRDGGTGTSELAPLRLSAQDRNDLVAFLETLTGQPGGAPDLISPPDAGLAPSVTCPDGGASGDGP